MAEKLWWPDYVFVCGQFCDLKIQLRQKSVNSNDKISIERLDWGYSAITSESVRKSGPFELEAWNSYESYRRLNKLWAL